MSECLIFFIVGFFFLFICRLKTKTFVNCGCIFIFIWTIVGMFSNLQVYNLIKPSNLANYCMLVGIFVMGFMYSFFSSSYKININKVKSKYSDINSNIILIINILVFIYLLPFFLKSLHLILNNSFTYLRSLYGIASIETGQTSFSNLLIASICYPVIIATEIIAIVCLYLKKKEMTKILIFGTVNLIIYSIMSAARNGFVLLLFFIIIGYLKIGKIVEKQRYRKKEKKNIILYLILIIVISFIIIITKDRSLSNGSFIYTFYIYFFAGPSFLTVLLEDLATYGYTLNENLLFGTATFGFLYNIFALFANVMEIGVVNSDYVINSLITSNSYYIGGNTVVNAMSTIFFPFLMDWGYLGIFIGMFFFSATCLYVERKMIFKNNLRWIAFSMYLIYVTYRSVFKFEGISISFFFTLFFIFIFSQKIKIKI